MSAGGCLFVEGRPRASYPERLSGGHCEARMAGLRAGESGLAPHPGPRARSFVEPQGRWLGVATRLLLFSFSTDSRSPSAAHAHPFPPRPSSPIHAPLPMPPPTFQHPRTRAPDHPHHPPIPHRMQTGRLVWVRAAKGNPGLANWPRLTSRASLVPSAPEHNSHSCYKCRDPVPDFPQPTPRPHSTCLPQYCVLPG